MAFWKRTVAFLQKELDELPDRRPLILHLVFPARSTDYQRSTPQRQDFLQAKGLPEGVARREGNPNNHCLVEARAAPGELQAQLAAALEAHREAAYKVVVVNGHGCPEGVLLREDEGDERVVLTGKALAEILSGHHHTTFMHLISLSAYGHKLAEDVMNFVRSTYKDDGAVRRLFAVTFFTSEGSPDAWERTATTGTAHVDLKRDVTGFLTRHVQPNSPYAVLDQRMARSACNLL